MAYDYGNLNETLNAMQRAIELVRDCAILEADAKYLGDRTVYLVEVFRALRAELMVMSAQTQTNPLNSISLGDIVSITLPSGTSYILGKIARYVLYCLQDGRAPSNKYSVDQYLETLTFLEQNDLIAAPKGPGEHHTLTARGLEAVGQLRAMHG